MGKKTAYTQTSMKHSEKTKNTAAKLIIFQKHSRTLIKAINAEAYKNLKFAEQMRKEKYRLKLAPEIESTTTGSRFKYKCSKNRILNEGEKTLPRSLYKRMAYQSEKRGKKEIILQNRSRSGPLLKGIFLH